MINSYEYIYKWSCVRNKFDCRQGNKDGVFKPNESFTRKKNLIYVYMFLLKKIYKH